jgi:hypothetical protein
MRAHNDGHIDARTLAEWDSWVFAVGRHELNGLTWLDTLHRCIELGLLVESAARDFLHSDQLYEIASGMTQEQFLAAVLLLEG